jgi:RHS repeat-associated protein
VRNRWYPAATRDARVEWDFEDRLVKVTKADGTVVENVYDVDGVLVRTSVNGVATDLLVDTSGGLSHVVAEIDGNGAVSVLYVRAGDMLLEEVRGGVAKMYEADGLGSVRGLLDVSGAKTDAYVYEAFGETLSHSGGDDNPYQFAGERYVDSVGMYQNRARWLDPKTGRFVSVDPEEGDDGRPTTFNPYIYVAGNPATYTDATGRDYTIGEQMFVVSTISVAAISNWGCSGRSRIQGNHGSVYYYQYYSDPNPMTKTATAGGRGYSLAYNEWWASAGDLVDGMKTANGNDIFTYVGHTEIYQDRVRGIMGSDDTTVYAVQMIGALKDNPPSAVVLGACDSAQLLGRISTNAGVAVAFGIRAEGRKPRVVVARAADFITAGLADGKSIQEIVEGANQQIRQSPLGGDIEVIVETAPTVDLGKSLQENGL